MTDDGLPLVCLGSFITGGWGAVMGCQLEMAFLRCRWQVAAAAAPPCRPGTVQTDRGAEAAEAIKEARRLGPGAPSTDFAPLLNFQASST